VQTPPEKTAKGNILHPIEPELQEALELAEIGTDPAQAAERMAEHVVRQFLLAGKDQLYAEDTDPAQTLLKLQQHADALQERVREPLTRLGDSGTLTYAGVQRVIREQLQGEDTDPQMRPVMDAVLRMTDAATPAAFFDSYVPGPAAHVLQELEAEVTVLRSAQDDARLARAKQEGRKDTAAGVDLATTYAQQLRAMEALLLREPDAAQAEQIREHIRQAVRHLGILTSLQFPPDA
jgi:hypothetical protein